MKLEFNNDLINAYNKMQKIYVLDDKSILTIEEVKDAIKNLLNVFKNLFWILFSFA